MFLSHWRRAAKTAPWHSEAIDYFGTLGLFPEITPLEPINGHAAFAATTIDGGGWLILLAIDDNFSIAISGADMPEGEFRQIAERVRIVEADEWEVHGGVFIECVFVSPDCDVLPPKYQQTTIPTPSTEKLATTTGPY